MRRQVLAIDSLSIDPFNDIQATRPQAHLMPRTPGNNAQRRPPTARAYDRDAFHV
jgi:hypothetical protein